MPKGVHDATLVEIQQRFGTNYRRRQLLTGLKFVVDRLRGFGVTTVWIDGSFVTAKERPRDVDVIYDPPPNTDTTTWGLLSPSRRKELKQYYGVDLWRHPSPQPTKGNPLKTETLLEMMSTDRAGVPKGVLKLVEGEDDS